MAKPDPSLLDPARYPHTAEVATRYADLDTNHHINNTALAALFEDVRVRMVTDVRGTWDGSIATMIASLTIDYLNQAHYPLPITVHSAVIRAGRTSITVQQLARQNDIAVAIASTVIVLTDGHRPVPIPEEWRAALATLELRA